MRVLFFLIGLFLIAACKKANQTAFITHLPVERGIGFSNTLSPTKDLNILAYLYYYNGAGVATGDFNNDGLDDLYFIGNQTADRLYLNKGSFNFEDITEQAGIDNADGWSFGVSVVDINADGLLDIYISKVGAYKTLEGQNLLFVNHGSNKEGIPLFMEEAHLFGLDLVSFSTQAAFFDYDLDGDLDLYQLNHSVHPNRSYGKGTKRHQFDELAGDRLLENRSGQFVDVSEAAGIFQGSIGYGLGVSISDINNDGWPDIYVGNDFFENDYLYINKGDGTFYDLRSTTPESLGHTSHYSMGNAVADFNNDGLMDIISLDMLPEDIQTYKTSGLEDPFSIYAYYLKNGYAPQYMQNTLHINRGEAVFSEIGYFAGIAATEWSWSALAADFDLDGHKDLYITNGILGATNDMDFVSFIAQDNIQRAIVNGVDPAESLIDQVPSKKVPNYCFRNNGDATFEDVSSQWFTKENTYGAGAVAVDLDNDGDLDIVVNNTNSPPSLYENVQPNQHHYLKVQFKGDSANPFGIGARLRLYADSLQVKEENFPTGSYLSSASPTLNVGLGSHATIDSLVVIWPDGRHQHLQDIGADQLITLHYSNASAALSRVATTKRGLLTNELINLDFEHREEPTLEFDRDPLIPFTKDHEGPRLAVGDVNGDGLDDCYIGGAKRQDGALFLQATTGDFNISPQPSFEEHAMSEDTDNLLFDADNDGDLDLLVVAGGNEFRNGKPLQPRLYLNEEGEFSHYAEAFTGLEMHASVLKSIDFDKDGDQDLIIGSNTITGEFGEPATNYLLENMGNNSFRDVTAVIAPEFANLGLIEDLVVVDFNSDGFEDAIAVGHWMPITLLINQDGNQLEPSGEGLQATHGWWNAVEAADFDLDGDLDFVAGNWGLNSRLNASVDEPITLYRNDFDGNGKIEPILAYYFNGTETTLASKDELVRQLPGLNKKFRSYASFAEADLTDLFVSGKLRSADQQKVYTLATSYFENLGDQSFKQHTLPLDAQISSVHALLVTDFNRDHYPDILMGGNSYEISTQLGRLDASHGTLLLNDQKGGFYVGDQTFNIAGPVRDIRPITVAGTAGYLVAINNGKPVFLKHNSE